MNRLEQDVEVLDLLDDEFDLPSFVRFGSFLREQVGERPGVHDVLIADVGDDESVRREDDLDVVVEVELERASEAKRGGRERRVSFERSRVSPASSSFPHLLHPQIEKLDRLTCSTS